MSVLWLSHTFRRLSVLGRNISTVAKQSSFQGSELIPINDHLKNVPNVEDFLVKFSPRSTNFDVDLPTNNSSLIKNIIESPLIIHHEIENPLKVIIEKIDIAPDTSVDLPTLGTAMPKSAIHKQPLKSMILIRRRKVKKHKRRKRRKKNTALLLKINKRRGVKREKIFQAELWAKVKEAQKFNAKEYVASRIDLLTKVKIPPVYQGHILPEAKIKELMEEERKKKEKRIFPRLTM